MCKVILQGTFRLASAADRDAFLLANDETMRISRGEQGCEEYVMAPDPIEADRVVLSERWESTSDLEEHLRALVGRRNKAARAGSGPPVPEVLERQIQRFEVSSEEVMN
jgi:quinol monooxygenase YgiN